MRAPVLALALLLAATPLQAQHHDADPGAVPVAGLGTAHFPNSGSAQAQPPFLRGLLLLHSFEYQQALQAFAQARAIDPGFAMAHWGEAMALNHPVWDEQDTAAGRRVLGLLGSTAAQRQARAPTDRERAYLAAVEQLYFGAGDKPARDAAYSAAMGELATRFPDDLDARAFHALSLLGLGGAARDTANYMRAAGVAETVYERDPRHPGALHYLIHAYDDPLHAPLGLRAARRYASVAPAASHAQHMPSHIFFALGLWDDAVDANTAAMKTARDRGEGGYHPLHWLAHAWLQLGRRDDAARLVRMVETDLRDKPSQAARAHLAMTRATWLVETRGADIDTLGAAVAPDDIVSIAPFAALDLARGLAQVEHADRAAARASLAALRRRIDQAGTAGPGAAAGASRYAAVQPAELDAARIMAQMLEAALAYDEGRHDAALALAQQAASAEDAAVFEYGPPWTVKPPHELLAELLARNGQAGEAATAYRQVLRRYPNRRLALDGLRRLPDGAVARGGGAPRP